MRGSTINFKIASEGLIQIVHKLRLLTWLRQSLKGKQPLQSSDQCFPNARQQQICVSVCIGLDLQANSVFLHPY